MLGRRHFSLLLGSALLINPVAAKVSQSTKGLPLFLSAASDTKDQHWVAGFSLENASANIKFKQALPGRAHQIVINEALGLFVVVARRPGKFLFVGDLLSGEILKKLEVPEDRHLLGHGVFSGDGFNFYTLESAYQDLTGDNGRLVIWRIQRQNNSIKFERLQEFPSYGIGPHELKLMPDHRTLVIANGGIRTHPETGRKKLNLDTMKPSLVYIDRHSGELLEQHWLDDKFHQASIRHLDVNAQGGVILAMQYQGEAFEEVPLVASHQRGEGLRMLEIPLQIQQQMKQYVGSIKFDASGDYIAASCPRGNMITFWAMETGRYIDSVRSRDGCGVCATVNGFVFTAGTGRINHFNLETNDLVRMTSAVENEKYNKKDNKTNNKNEKIFWDNHLSFSLLSSVL